MKSKQPGWRPEASATCGQKGCLPHRVHARVAPSVTGQAAALPGGTVVHTDFALPLHVDVPSLQARRHHINMALPRCTAVRAYVPALQARRHHINMALPRCTAVRAYVPALQGRRRRWRAAPPSTSTLPSPSRTTSGPATSCGGKRRLARAWTTASTWPSRDGTGRCAAWEEEGFSGGRARDADVSWTGMQAPARIACACRCGSSPDSGPGVLATHTSATHIICLPEMPPPDM